MEHHIFNIIISIKGMVTTRGATRSKGSLIHMKNTKVKCEK